MPRSIISEGNTTNEAIEKGLKELNLPKECVEIKVIEKTEKRSFFSILTPRVVSVELTVKEESDLKPKEKIKVSREDIEIAEKKIKDFLEPFIKDIPEKEIQYEIIEKDGFLNVIMQGKEINYLIGYRGEVLNSLQTILSSIANRNAKTKVRVLLDIQGYRKAREKTLEELAQKVSKTVIRKGKAITLEPMSSYERKIIHSKLQENTKVKTYSIGEEPYRKVVIALK